MTPQLPIYLWRKAPFLRLLVPLTAGILYAFYLQPPVRTTTIAIPCLLLLYLLFRLLPLKAKFRYRPVQGVLLTSLLFFCGHLLLWNKDIRNHDSWYGKYLTDQSCFLATVVEPPEEKPRSYKVILRVDALIKDSKGIRCRGTLLAYFKKDSVPLSLQYGDQILFKKPLQRIPFSGNPSSFNYREYCAFSQIYHQVFLQKKDWVIMDRGKGSPAKKMICTVRQYVLNVLAAYIPGKDASAIAKALLIGYRPDLDKTLVQAYANTGVIHLIAISGMHLGIIYIFLAGFFKRLPFTKRLPLLRLLLILGCLWFFSLLTGASASVLRSAVMFTCLAAGESVRKRSPAYNSLAASAFLLFCYDPYLLWDVGFQLSFLAVLGILVTQKYIAGWFRFSSRIATLTWKAASVTLAAQVFTLPICLYYFHQFPLLFLLANLVAIPLSTIALWGCITVVAFSFCAPSAVLAGKLTAVVIAFLNHFITVVNNIPFSRWEHIQITPLQTMLLYTIFTVFLYGCLKKYRPAFHIALSGILLFSCLSQYAAWQTHHQKKIIVYNIPGHRAISFMEGDRGYFSGDEEVIAGSDLWHYNILPSYISYHIKKPRAPVWFFHKENFFSFHGCRLLLIENTLHFAPPAKKIAVDYIILSKNPSLSIKELLQIFDCKKIIFGPSSPVWKIEQWKKECEDLILPFHSVPEQGAIVINL